MAHTFHKHLYHLIWSTKEREPFILLRIKSRIFEYLGGALRKADCSVLQVGGMPDHVHILVGIPPKFAVSEVIREVKVCSSKWMRTTFPDVKSFAWQEGYGSFTVSPSQKDTVFKYIENQETHHSKRTFREEFIQLLNIHEIEYEEQYLWR